jgi:integrase
VPLSTRAVEILRALPRSSAPAFDIHPSIRDALWRKYRPKDLLDLHFHDTRSEAVSRLSKKFDVLQLARVIGHRDLNSLLIYYKESASEMAKRLD